jgi:probable F420-dependent oxidoreductase
VNGGLKTRSPLVTWCWAFCTIFDSDVNTKHRFDGRANNLDVDVDFEIGYVRPVAMKLALASPVVTLSPGTHGAWEEQASIDDLVRVAECADRLGFHHLTCSEHVGVPAVDLDRRGSRYWDPLATFGYLAARTTRILLATHVLVLGYHHPLAIAKRYGTLDLVSGGRLVLGVGVGSLEAEFDLLGAEFRDRGALADDAIRALRASLSQREPEYHGEHYDFGGLVIDPAAVQARVPIWVGGRTRRSLRRAVAFADGWNPFAVRATQAQEWLARVDLPVGFEVVLPAVHRIEPIDEPAQTQETLAATAACGATITYATFQHSSVAEYLEKLEALAAVHAGMNL